MSSGEPQTDPVPHAALDPEVVVDPNDCAAPKDEFGTDDFGATFDTEQPHEPEPTHTHRPRHSWLSACAGNVRTVFVTDSGMLAVLGSLLVSLIVTLPLIEWVDPQYAPLVTMFGIVVAVGCMAWFRYMHDQYTNDRHTEELLYVTDRCHQGETERRKEMLITFRELLEGLLARQNRAWEAVCRFLVQEAVHDALNPTCEHPAYEGSEGDGSMGTRDEDGPDR